MDNLRTVRAIFFDLGDTLINSRIFGPNGELKAVEAVVELVHLNRPPSDYLSLSDEAGQVVGALMEKGRPPGESLQEYGTRLLTAKYAKLIELMGGVPDEASADQVFRACLSGIATADSLFPEAREVLEALKGRYRLGLLSNNIVEYVRGPLEHLGLERFFDVVVISGEENTRKPEPAVFHRALERIGAKPSEAMMVGDSLLEDVAASQRVGMTAVWVNRSGEKPKLEVKPDYTIGDLRVLLELFEDLA
ncbi:MAG: HAD family hydrolase [Candidatus Latescibacteria bacterium]|nr:HAD family hydrolase [Candidatus Latescibacterota bacterium]